MKVGATVFLVTVTAGVWYIKRLSNRQEQQGNEIRLLQAELRRGNRTTESHEETLREHERQLLIGGNTLKTEIHDFLGAHPASLRLFFNALSLRLTANLQAKIIHATGTFVSSNSKEVAAVETIASGVPIPVVGTLASIIKILAEEEKIEQSEKFASAVVETLTKMKIVSIDNMILAFCFRATQMLEAKIESSDGTLDKFVRLVSRNGGSIEKYANNLADQIVRRFEQTQGSGNRALTHEHKE